MSYFSEEHKETIEIFKEEVEKEQKEYSRVNSYTQFLYDNCKAVLKLIEKQDKELEIKDKMIDKMAYRIVELVEKVYGNTHEQKYVIECFRRSI